MVRLAAASAGCPLTAIRKVGFGNRDRPVRVDDMAAVLAGSNVEAARAAVRGLTGDIPVFERNGKLYGRLAVSAVPLFSRCNPGLIEQVGSGGTSWVSNSLEFKEIELR